MSYDVGTHIDLSHLNNKVEAVPAVARKSAVQEAYEAAGTLYEVGTQFVFNQTQKKLTRRIPVAYA